MAGLEKGCIGVKLQRAHSITIGEFFGKSQIENNKLTSSPPNAKNTHFYLFLVTLKKLITNAKLRNTRLGASSLSTEHEIYRPKHWRLPLWRKPWRSNKRPSGR
jgi:hypothetical protein